MRPLAAGDEEEFIALARASMRLHQGMIFAPTKASEFGEYLARFDGVTSVGFVIRLNDTRELAGLVNINEIVRVPDAHGALGYGGFTATAGNGYVAEAVRLVVRYAFEELKLNRLEAYIQPENAASRRVLEKAGFQPVVSERKVIHIAGRPRDHHRWTIKATRSPDPLISKDHDAGTEHEAQRQPRSAGRPG